MCVRERKRGVRNLGVEAHCLCFLIISPHQSVLLVLKSKQEVSR
jgi:hypothetical protein